MLPGGILILCMIQAVFPGLDIYCTDLAQYVVIVGSDLIDDLCYLSVDDLSEA